jgi:predicted DNA-binding helix-hairpin-helix protein
VLLRVPGLGLRSVNKILASRRHRSLRLDDLVRLGGASRKFLPFVVAADHRPTRELDRAGLLRLVGGPAEQLNLFA